MKRRTQILILVMIATTAIYGLSVGYLGVFIKNQAIRDAKQIANNYATEYANKVRADLERDIGICRATASAMKSMTDAPFMEQVAVYNKVLRDIFVNYDYLAVSNSWELNAFAPGYTKTHGRLRSEFYEFGGEVTLEMDSIDMERDNVESLYYQVKLQNREVITQPYWYQVDERLDKILVTSIAAPVKIDGEFAGLAGVDRALSSIQDTLNQFKPFEEGEVYLLSHEGSFIAHPEDDNLGKKYSEIYPRLDKEFRVEQKVREGRTFSFMNYNEDGEDFFLTFAPFRIGNTGRTWSVNIVVPYSIIVKDANQNLTNAIIIGIFGLALLTGLFLFVSYRIARVLVDISDRLGSLSRGNIAETNKMNVKKETDELGRIKTSVNQLIDGLNKTVRFAVNIGKGNLDASYEKLSEEDAFGDALMDMRDNLRRVRNEEQKREEENRKRNWVNDGIAKVNDILRIYRNKETEEFAHQIVSNVVDYLEANQAGLFFVEESDNEEGYVIELKASYAYNRRKLIDKQINPGVGLIGRAVKEHRTIFLKDVPGHYLQITSGIGNSTPRNLLIVPLISEDYVYGVIELASFRVFKPHEQEFIARASEIIASAIATQRYSARTEELLKETNRKSEELTKQEQEMRQNLAELRAAQEESQRAEKEMASIIEAVNSTSSVIHLDPDGKIRKIVPSKNENSQVYPVQDAGAYLNEIDPTAIETPELYERLWDKLLEGKVQEKELHVEVYEDNRWIAEVYTPMLNPKGRVERVVLIQTDITERKMKEDMLKRRSEELQQKETKLRNSLDALTVKHKEVLAQNQTSEKIRALIEKAFLRAEFTLNGEILYMNEYFAISMGASSEELKHQNIFELVEIVEEKSIGAIQEELRNERDVEGEFRFSFNSGEKRWFLAKLSPEIKSNADSIRVHFIGYEVTYAKNLEGQIKEQSEKLKKLEHKLQQTTEDMRQSKQLILHKNARIQSVTEAIDKSFIRVEMNSQRVITEANNNVLNMLGYTRDKITQMTFDGLLREEEQKEFQRHLQQLHNGNSFQDKITLRGKNRNVLKVLYSLATIEDSKNKTIGFVFIGFDVTDL